MTRNFIIFLTAVIIIAGCKGKPQETTPIDSTQVCAEGIDQARSPKGMTIIRLQDKVSAMPKELFMGSADDGLLQELIDGEETMSSINTYLVRSLDHNILIDAGLGVERGGNMLAKLQYLNIKPEEIDAVCLTHLHTDHIGGLLKDGMPLFPNATLYLSVEEFNAWSDGGDMASQNSTWKEVLASYANKIQPFVWGDTLLDGVVITHEASGHTPGHTVYEVDNYLFVGDLVHAQDLQIEHPEYCAKYDNNPSQAVDTRMETLKEAREKCLVICGAHCYTPFIDIASWKK